MDRALGIRLDLSTEEPLYGQIRDRIAERIRSGALPPGHRLPPTRALADELGIHRNTVVRAFEELAAMGLVVSVVGRGTAVADTPRAAPGAELGALPELPWQRLLSRAADSEPLRRPERLSRAAEGRDLVNLSRMQPPEELIPDEELRRCIVHVLRTEGPRALGYAPREGLVRLRTLVSRELSAIGVGASAEDIVITTGSQQAIDLVARALIDPGDTVLVEASTYSGAIHALTVAGARLVGVPSDEDGPDPDALRALTTSGAKCLYLMPNSRNPTGTTISAQRRAELVAWSHEAGVPLVEDDYGADLDLDPDPPMPPALRALDPEVLYTGTFSKKLIPALRVGFLVCPPGLRRPIVALKHTMDLGTSALLQHALAEFIERGLLRAHLRRIVPIYRERRDALDHALKAHMPPYVRWVKPRSGLVLWLELPSWLDAEVVYEEALDHGVLVTPGTMNAVGTRGQRGLRLVYCSEPTERLEEGARRLGAALRTVAMRQRPASAGGPAIDIV